MICVEMRENLAADGVAANQVGRYMEQATRLCYMKTSEHAIISQMNEAIFYIEDVYEREDVLDLLKLNRDLNDFGMLKLPLFYSNRTMIQEMDNQFS